MKKKIAIIGASYLQVPLIKKAKEMGLETHVFAWRVGDEGEEIADFFYPISIVEKEKILYKCREIGIDGICSISSDLATTTVCYIAQKMKLTSNTIECSHKTTNKFLMRECFKENHDPSPSYLLIKDSENYLDVVNKSAFNFPVIVKPTDRSGSRGVKKCFSISELPLAIENAKECSFKKEIIIEEYIEGQEYSIESISYNGEHTVLNITYKITTGSPHFIETGHIEPAPLSDLAKEKIINVTKHALNSLGIRYGASHTEVKVDKSGNINIIEIGARMGGDMIGSHLIQLSTGFDFVKAEIQIALGKKPVIYFNSMNKYAAIKYIINEQDIKQYNDIKRTNPGMIVLADVTDSLNKNVSDSSNRNGYYIVVSNSIEKVSHCFPNEKIVKI